MAQLHVHYEAAFEDFIRSRGWPYVPVNEHRRAIFGGARIKSFDYLVYPGGKKGASSEGTNPPCGIDRGDSCKSHAWLVEVKGRKFPYISDRGHRYWENWVPKCDLEDLRRWHTVFGDTFEPVIVFAYWLTGPAARDPIPEVYTFRDRSYAFLWMPASQYEQACRGRSPKWDTVCLSTADFKRLAKPLPTS